MSVWHLVFATDSLTYTIAKALSYGGHDVFVRTVDRRENSGPLEGIQKRLRDTPRVTFVGQDDSTLPSNIDRLIVQAFPRPTESLDHVGRLARRARKITLITAGDRSRPWRTALALQWLEVRRIGRHARKVDRVVYKDGFYPRDLLGLVASRQVIGFDVHSQFLHDPVLYRAMHARDWSPGSRRPILANFLGSQDPDTRKRILDQVRPLFHSGDKGARPVPGEKTMFWHEYSDASPIGLPPEEFVRMLTNSDFALCPRGYSLVTHRPIEALLRGSIPVLASDEFDLYGIDLKDGENCIGVKDGRWAEALHRLGTLREDEIIRMRRRIGAMFESHLNYDALSRRMRACLGVADQGA
jgi:hypothetical protein